MSEENTDAETAAESTGEIPSLVDLREPMTAEEQEFKDVTRKTRAELFYATKFLRILKDYFDELIKNANPESNFARKLVQVRQVLDTSAGELFGEGGIEAMPIDQRAKECLSGILGMSLELEDKDTDTIKVLIATKADDALKVLTDIEDRPVLSHRERGFALDEASLESARAALEAGIAEVEFDFRASKESIPVRHHNATLGASAGGEGAIHEFTEEELKQMELKGGGHIITLKDFFDLVVETDNEVTKINLDIKDFDEAMLDEMLRLIKEYHMEHRVVFVSWLPQVLQFLYEKDKTLIYSMSYFPTVRKATELALDAIVTTYGEVLKNIPGVDQMVSWTMSHIGSWVAQKRAEAATSKDGQVLSTGAEMITSAHFLPSEEHWRDTKARFESKNQDLIGKHTFAVGPVPPKGLIMQRVLEGGSINVQAFEEVLYPIVDKVPFLSERQKGMLLDLLSGMTSMAKFAAKCAENGITVNVFDLKDPANVDKRFQNLEDVGVKPGVVYTSNPDLVPRVEITKPGSGAPREEDESV